MTAPPDWQTRATVAERRLATTEQELVVEHNRAVQLKATLAITQEANRRHEAAYRQLEEAYERLKEAAAKADKASP